MKKETIESYSTACINIEDNLDDIFEKLNPTETMLRLGYLLSQKMIKPIDIDRFENHYIKKEKNYISNPKDVPLEDFELADLLVSRTDAIKMVLRISNGK